MANKTYPHWHAPSLRRHVSPGHPLACARKQTHLLCYVSYKQTFGDYYSLNIFNPYTAASFSPVFMYYIFPKISLFIPLPGLDIFCPHPTLYQNNSTTSTYFNFIKILTKYFGTLIGKNTDY